MKEGARGFGPNDRRGTDDKESARDFVLWKAYTEQDGEVRYESSFGPGRPGWHIECSAMINKILGPTIDIHAGGVDLVFPHHQNEIAQSEAYTGQEFCKYWVHNGFVNINNEKMSKSLKNFKTLRQLADKPEDARAFRYMVVTAQYRSPLNFMPDSLTSARQSLKRLDKFSMKIKAIADSGEVITSVETDAYVQEATEKCIEDFEAAMCDDMNTPRAIAALFSLVSKGEKLMKGTVPELAPLSSTNAAHVAETVRKLDSVLGVFYDVPTAYFSTAAAVEPIDEPLDFDSLEPNVQELLAARVRAKVDKDWASADKTRDDLLELGLRVKDTKDSGRGFEVFRV